MSTGHAPNRFIFWDGIPLDQLGVDRALVSAKMTMTVGKKSKDKKFKGGKTKLSGASLEFLLADQVVASRVRAQLLKNPRPLVTIAFGYDDSPNYYVGSFGPNAPVNVKDKGKVAAFRISSTSWSYDSSGHARLSMNGATDKAMAMAEVTKPRVFAKSSIRQALQQVADDHNLELEIDPDLPADAKLPQISKTVRENDLDFVRRISDKVGADGVFVHIRHKGAQETARIAATGSTPYVSKAALYAGLPPAEELQAVLSVNKLPVFADPKRRRRKYTIAYGPNVPDAGAEEIDFLAQSVKIDEKGYGAGTTGTASKQKSNNETDVTETSFGYTTGKPGDRKEHAIVLKIGQSLKDQVDQRNAGLNTRRQEEGAKDAKSSPTEMIDPMPGATPDQVSAALMAVAVRRGLSVSIDITLFPGIPWLQAADEINLVGTLAHDGAYGVEECTQDFGSTGGLKTTLKCKPLGVARAGSDGGAEDEDDETSETSFGYTTGKPGDRKEHAIVLEIGQSLKDLVPEIKTRITEEPVPKE